MGRLTEFVDISAETAERSSARGRVQIVAWGRLRGVTILCALGVGHDAAELLEPAWRGDWQGSCALDERAELRGVSLGAVRGYRRGSFHLSVSLSAARSAKLFASVPDVAAARPLVGSRGPDIAAVGPDVDCATEDSVRAVSDVASRGPEIPRAVPDTRSPRRNVRHRRPGIAFAVPDTRATG
jgi:hypothetical protein